MSRMIRRRPPRFAVKCAACGSEVEPNQASVIVDGELVHEDCALEDDDYAWQDDR
jgi:hypothetical protein